MMIAIWWCVMVSAFAPGGAHFVDNQLNAYNAHWRAQLETLSDTLEAAAKPRVRATRAI